MFFVLGVCLLSFFLVHRLISKEVFMNWCKVPYLVMPSVLVLKYMNRNGFLYRFFLLVGHRFFGVIFGKYILVWCS